MTQPSARRPLPALVFLLGLSLLTALVWWRVIHRDNQANEVTPNPTCAPTPADVVPQPSSVQVQVRNSTTRNGLAAATEATLKTLGFQVTGIDDVTPTVTGTAVIKYNGPNLGAAKLLQTYIPGSTITNTAPSAGNVELDLGTQFTSVLSAADATKALAAAHLTLAAPITAALTCTTPTPAPTATPTPSTAAASATSAAPSS